MELISLWRAIRPVFVFLTVLALVGEVLSIPQTPQKHRVGSIPEPTQNQKAISIQHVPPKQTSGSNPTSNQQGKSGQKNAKDILEWAVIGDSWASGVAYNVSNVYGPTDKEFCYRINEAWGAQMGKDNSWVSGIQSFHFAACGGSLMLDLERQMKEKAGTPSVVWGMFGGNDAFFGNIARACIYQPLPGGWGPAWDEEDPNGKSLCKKNIKDSEESLNDPTGWRVKFTRALDDIFHVAEKGRPLNYPFDLYVSSYVRFFDDTTDACDKWSFAHDTVSTGHPKLVQGLRKVINQKVQQVNDLQADIIKTYKIPPSPNPNLRIHNVQPDPIFKGHRFCEKGRTYEDQFYHNDLWLWNLQYYDEKKGEEAGVVMTDNNGTKFMGNPKGVNVTQGFATVLGSDGNPNASFPQGGPVNTTQFGFGWTARPFHPKYEGHKALKELFIQKMKDDHISGVAPAVMTATSPPTSPPSSPAQKQQQCYGLGQNKYITRDGAKDVIETFCPEASNKGPIERQYNKGTPDEVTIRLQGPVGFKPSLSDCKDYLLSVLIDGCDGDNKQNPANYKGGGKETIGNVVYEIQPTASRQPASMGKTGGCYSKYKLLFNEVSAWGHGWDNSDHGAALYQQLKGCAILPDTWHFDYGLGDNGREWTAKFRTGVFQKKCTGHAGISAGGPSDFGCAGSG